MTPAIILAGSHVWNAESLESLCPRVLLPVVNIRLVDHLLDWLRDAGVETVTICANDASAALRAYLGDGAERDLDVYYYEDRIPRGPGGCLRDAMMMFDADQFLVVDGSILPSSDLAGLLDAHRESGAAATVAVYECAEAEGPNGPDLSPAGVYVFARHAARHVSESGYQDIKEGVIPRLSRSGQEVVTYLAHEPTPRIDGLESYFDVQAWALERLAAGEMPLPEQYVLREQTCVHRTARLGDGARLIGAVMIGPDTLIGDDSIIIGPSVIGRECALDRRTVIGRSVLWDQCSIGEGAMIDQSLVTSGVEVGAGAVRQSTVCCAEPERPRRNGQVREGSPGRGPRAAALGSR